MKSNNTKQTVYQTICWIASKEAQMQALRQELNLQITFNLKDVYMTVAKEQTAVSLKRLAEFLYLRDGRKPSLDKLIRWNNHNTSLNLSFAQFSALIVSKEDRLLAKVVVQRESMGAIPNYLLQIVRRILLLQLQVHQFCLKSEIQTQSDLIQWLEEVTDEQGDIDPAALNAFIFRNGQDEEDTDSRLFLRYLKNTGNITAQRLRFLWSENILPHDDFSDNFNKISTQITCPNSPKSLLSYKSYQQLPVIRTEYYDCLSRPIFSQDTDIRKKKSIEKHLSRIDSSHKLKLIVKVQHKKLQQQCNLKILLFKLKEILNVQAETEELRVELCMCPDFYPVLFYDTLPKEKNKTVLASNFKDYLEQFGYPLDLNLVYFLFRRYSQQVGRINFNSFCAIFDVSQTQYNLIEKNRFVESLTDIQLNTKRLFLELICLSAKNEAKINDIKIKLLKNCLNLTDTIDALFRQFPEGLDEDTIKDLYKGHLNYSFHKRDVKLLWRKVGVNLGNEEKIQKNHLLSELIPINTLKRNNKF